MRVVKNWLIIFLIAAIGIEAVALWQLNRKSVQLRLAAAMGQSHNNELQGHLASMLKAKPPGETASSSATYQAGKPPRRPNTVHLSDFSRDYPEYVALLKEKHHRMIMDEYRKGLAALHLPSGTVANVADLLVRGSRRNTLRLAPNRWPANPGKRPAWLRTRIRPSPRSIDRLRS